MKQRTYEIQIGRNLVIYLHRDGTLDSAMDYRPPFNDWNDCTELVNGNEKLLDEARDRLQSILDAEGISEPYE